MRKTLFSSMLLASSVILAACGRGDDGEASAADASASQSPASVIIHRQGVVDADPAAVDAPEWPGPDPAVFLEPDPPSGEKGELTGEDAGTVYRAALDHPDALLKDGQEPGDLTAALWTVDRDIQMLVVEPVW